MALMEFDCICGHHLYDYDRVCHYCGNPIENTIKTLLREMEKEKLSLKIEEMSEEIIKARREWLRNYATLQRVDELEELKEQRFKIENTLGAEKYWTQKVGQWKNREKTFWGTVKAGAGIIPAVFRLFL